MNGLLIPNQNNQQEIPQILQDKWKIQIKPLWKHLTIKTGYSERKPLPSAFSIVLHTTNGKRNSLFSSEERFLLTTSKVSAHFLIGKEGQITQFLPIALEAWHTGTVYNPNYDNQSTIGIEMHYTPYEPIFKKQLDTLERLCQCLNEYIAIVDIVTHRGIAKPKGRKIDPSNMLDSDVDILRDRIPYIKQYMIKSGALLYTEPECINPAVHINDNMYDRGIARYMLLLDGKPIQASIWIASGIGFHKITDCERV